MRINVSVLDGCVCLCSIMSDRLQFAVPYVYLSNISFSVLQSSVKLFVIIDMCIYIGMCVSVYVCMYAAYEWMT